MQSWLEIACPFALALFCAIAAERVGRAAPDKPLVVQYESPDHLSPAAARYVWKGCVDQRTTAAVFTQLAIKGCIHILPENGHYLITKLKSQPPKQLAPEEQLAMDWLFSNFLEENRFKPVEDSQGCIAALTGSIEKQMRGRYHLTHYGMIFLAFLLGIAMAFLMAAFVDTAQRGGVFLFTWFAFAGTVLSLVTTEFTLVSAIRDLWKGIGNYGRVIFGMLLAVFLFVSLGFLGTQLASISSISYAVSITSLAVIVVIAGHYLRSTTPRGYEVQHGLEGFREFLLAVEQDRLDRVNVPDRVLEHKEVNLPYAIALEVKEAWGDTIANACYPQLSR